MKYNYKDMFGYDIGDRVVFTGCDDCQVSYGGHADPRPLLKVGESYEVAMIDVHSWNTDIYLKGFEDFGFNSVCFEAAE